MADYDFNDFRWFLVLAREKSFTRAAAKLGVAQSTLSHTIKRLEGRLSLRLFARTTRSVGLTEAGQRLVEAVGPRLDAIETDLAVLLAAQDAPSGSVRITLSDHAMDWCIWPRIGPVLQRYPGIRLELNCESSLRNIVEDGFDAGIRLGESLEKDMIAVRVSPDWRLVAVASPGYFADRSMPQNPRDLMAHNCINLRHSVAGGHYAWEFAKAGQEMRVRVEGQLTFNSSRAAVQAAIEGHGIAYAPEDLLAAPLRDGRLVAVLEDWSPHFPGYFLYYPSRSQNAPAFTAIVNALRVR
jgi:DNA-binding transcriptional LysR family regulator